VKALRLLGAVLLLAGVVGCAAKKPQNIRYLGCRVFNTWVDEQGNQRKDCDCLHGKQIGTEAKTGAAIMLCE
jgi:hypothetical protein